MMGTMNRKNMAATLATLALGQLFYLTAHADPMNTYCHMGVCSWEEIVSEEILSGNNIENGYLVMTRSVKFNTYHEGDYPKSYSSNMLKIDERISSTYVYCSLDRPAVFWDNSGEIETLHILSPFGYEYPSATEYLYTCHKKTHIPAPELVALGYKDNGGIIFPNAQYLMQIRFESKISPSFDCNLAETEDEIAICNNNRLASLDLINADSYKMLKEVMGKEQAKEFARAALKERRKCKGDVQCIEQVLVWTDENYKRILGAE